MNNAKSVEAGQAVYSKKVLLVYDFWVLGFSNSLLWKCPTKVLKNEFVKNASLNHLDIGVGTGYYLEKCLVGAERRLALLDLNLNSLGAAASRVKHIKTETYHANILETLEFQCDKFDSVSLNFLLHCLPGTLTEKSIVFNNIIPYLNDGAVVFGSTILGEGTEAGFLAKKLMSIYNKKRIFDNAKDNLNDLLSSLNFYFSEVDVQVIGCVALFTAKYNKTLQRASR